MKEKIIPQRTIKPGDKNKGRDNPTTSILVGVSEIKETTIDIVLHKDGTFEVEEGPNS